MALTYVATGALNIAHKEFQRFGEARHPGPYSTGGATSSGEIPRHKTQQASLQEASRYADDGHAAGGSMGYGELDSAVDTRGDTPYRWPMECEIHRDPLEEGELEDERRFFEDMHLARWLGNVGGEGGGQASHIGGHRAGDLSSQLQRDEEGPPPELDEEWEEVAEQMIRRLGVRLDHEALFASLQEASRKESEARYKKWAWLKGMKAQSSTRSKQAATAAKCVEDCRESANDRLKKLGHTQPSPAPTIEEERDGEQTGEVDKRECARSTVKEGTKTVQRKRPKKRRGKRQRGSTQFEVITLNSSGLPQLQEALSGQKIGRKGNVAILSQEHHRVAPQLPDLQSMARRNGWKGTVVQATTGEGGGIGAGVATFTPLHIPCGELPCVPHDISPKGSEGRAIATWMQQIVPCGTLLSVYLHTGEGPSPRNKALLGQALQVVGSSGTPWIMGGDFQDTPEEVESWAGEDVARARGRFYYGMEPTIYPSNGAPRVIDYFIVAEELAHMVEKVSVKGELAVSPHRAVALILKSSSQPLLLNRLRTPKTFPREKPVGCPRQPVAPGADFTKKAEIAEKGEAKLIALTESWTDLVWAIESELCGVTDHYKEGGPDMKWCGRALGPRYVKEVALPTRSSGKWGKLDHRTYAV